MNNKIKWRDLKFLAEFLEDMEWEAELLGEETPYPSLKAALPMDEDYDETVLFTYIDLPDEDAEFTKYLQIYLQIPLDLETIPAGEMIVFVNQLNILTLLGGFSYIPKIRENAARVDYRYVLPVEKDTLPEEGVVGEVLLNLVKYAQMAEGLIARRIEGTPMEAIIAAIQKEIEDGEEP